jgi:hypothetical protein
MTSNGTLQDGCEERHNVRFRKRWRCLLPVNGGIHKYPNERGTTHASTKVESAFEGGPA